MNPLDRTVRGILEIKVCGDSYRSVLLLKAAIFKATSGATSAPQHLWILIASNKMGRSDDDGYMVVSDDEESNPRQIKSIVKTVKEVKTTADAGTQLKAVRPGILTHTDANGADWSVLRAEMEALCGDIMGDAKRGNSGATSLNPLEKGHLMFLCKDVCFNGTTLKDIERCNFPGAVGKEPNVLKMAYNKYTDWTDFISNTRSIAQHAPIQGRYFEESYNEALRAVRQELSNDEIKSRPQKEGPVG
ncbi:unnamed protein product [Heligmosomoides polygyrus]|uniref:Helitron helicase n=1 Tax=Heligmosomoides polygyrus TaxID=6339 RepID=A0A3P7TAN1_HELPZ|nr:unnamed protein product [Heligmosomoides polygyrus]